MELVSPAGGRKNRPVQHTDVAALRDVGERLKYLLVRYERLVTRVTDGRVPVPDMTGRVDWLNLQIAAAADHLQELIVFGVEGNRAVPFRRDPARSGARHGGLVVRRVVAGTA